MGSLDVIDYVALEKRGIIKKKEVKKMAAPISKDGFVDFSAIGQDKINEIAGKALNGQSLGTQPTSMFSDNNLPSSPAQTPQTSGFTSFWDQLPGQTTQATTSTETSYYGNQSSYGSPTSDSNSSSNNQDNQDMASLKVKLDDLEYKLARLTEKLDLITSKL